MAHLVMTLLIVSLIEFSDARGGWGQIAEIHQYKVDGGRDPGSTSVPGRCTRMRSNIFFKSLVLFLHLKSSSVLSSSAHRVRRLLNAVSDSPAGGAGPLPLHNKEQ